LTPEARFFTGFEFEVPLVALAASAANLGLGFGAV